MKILRKIILLFIVEIMIFTVISSTQVNVFASSSLNSNNRKINNVAVLFYNLDDYMLQLKQNLEDIQKENENKINFTFYDGKNNIAVQNETFDSAINSNVDLLIINLASKKEDIVEDFVLRAKQKNIPLILLEIDPQIASRLSSYYNKATFVLPSDSDQVGILEGKIIVDMWNNNKELLDKNGDNILRYVLLQGEAYNPVAIERTKSSISIINNSGIKAQQLELINANWSRELSEKSIESLFLKFGNKIEAIISNSDAMAIGAINALQKYGYNKGDKSKYIAVVGVDGLPEAKDLIDKGFMTGTVTQDPKAYAQALYTIGINLINNVTPIENTDYKLSNGQIIIPMHYEEYTKK